MNAIADEKTKDTQIDVTKDLERLQQMGQIGDDIRKAEKRLTRQQTEESIAQKYCEARNRELCLKARAQTPEAFEAAKV